MKQHLLPDPNDLLGLLCTEVQARLFAPADAHWREINVCFADERAFLDISARKSDGRPRVLIEAGDQGPGGRNLLGFFDALWDQKTHRFLQIEVASFAGMAVGIEDFSHFISPYLTLPESFAESAVEEHA